MDGRTTMRTIHFKSFLLQTCSAIMSEHSLYRLLRARLAMHCRSRRNMTRSPTQAECQSGVLHALCVKFTAYLVPFIFVVCIACRTNPSCCRFRCHCRCHQCRRRRLFSFKLIDVSVAIAAAITLAAAAVFSTATLSDCCMCPPHSLSPPLLFQLLVDCRLLCCSSRYYLHCHSRFFCCRVECLLYVPATLAVAVVFWGL